MRLSGISLHSIVLLKQQSGNTISLRQTAQEIPAQKHAGMTKGVYAGMTKGVHAGMTKGVHAGMTKGVHAGMTREMHAGMAKGVHAGMTDLI